MDVDAELAGEVSTGADKGKEKEVGTAEEDDEEADVVAPLPQAASTSRPQSRNQNGPPSAPRSSSQPPRSRGGLRDTSAEPPTSTTRRTRAGSAGPSRASGRLGANGGLPAVREWEVGRFSVGGSPLDGATAAITTNGQAAVTVATATTSTAVVDLAPNPPLPLPRERDNSFISYPLPNDPVQELKALTHFDSGSEFFGTESKQGYKTDWHDGMVLDDLFDAETMARSRALVAEDGPSGGIHGPHDDADADGVEIYGDLETPTGPTLYGTAPGFEPQF